MKFVIKHDIKGRIRVHFINGKMSYRDADIVQYYFENLDCIEACKVFNRTSDVVLNYTCTRNNVLKLLRTFSYKKVNVPDTYLENTGRELNEYYKEKLIDRVMVRYGCKFLLPTSVKIALTVYNATKYIVKGIKVLAKGKLEVPVLDATAIGVSVFRGDTSTAGSIMFLLGIGELLEEWTHKKSVSD